MKGPLNWGVLVNNIWKKELSPCHKLKFFNPYNIVVKPIFINLNTPRYITQYIIWNLTTLVNKNIKHVITFINLTCTIEVKIYVSWNKTLLHYGNRLIVPHLANKRGPESILKDTYRLGITVSCILQDRYL